MSTTDANQALLVVDVVNPLDFPGGKQLLAQALPVVRSIARLKRRLKARGRLQGRHATAWRRRPARERAGVELNRRVFARTQAATGSQRLVRFPGPCRHDGVFVIGWKPAICGIFLLGSCA